MPHESILTFFPIAVEEEWICVSFHPNNEFFGMFIHEECYIIRVGSEDKKEKEERRRRKKKHLEEILSWGKKLGED